MNGLIKLIFEEIQFQFKNKYLLNIGVYLLTYYYI